jgi:hypothetical protein
MKDGISLIIHQRAFEHGQLTAIYWIANGHCLPHGFPIL